MVNSYICVWRDPNWCLGHAFFKSRTKQTYMKRIVILTLAVAFLMSVTPSEARRKGLVEEYPALAPYFCDSSDEAMAPDGQGFIRRWLLLEPISKPNRTNTVFVDSYLRKHLDTGWNKDGFKVPENGDKVTMEVEEQAPVDLTAGRPRNPFEEPEKKIVRKKLTWHALDSKLFNVKLYRYAVGTETGRYGAIFRAVTVIDVPEDLENVRLAVGSNSASMWWIDSEEALILSGDRRMVMDDGASKRMTLKKGRHVITGAVINGPGMSDFCVRFIDEDGNPVLDYTITKL